MDEDEEQDYEEEDQDEQDDLGGEDDGEEGEGEGEAASYRRPSYLMEVKERESRGEPKNPYIDEDDDEDEDEEGPITEEESPEIDYNEEGEDFDFDPEEEDDDDYVPPYKPGDIVEDDDLPDGLDEETEDQILDNWDEEEYTYDEDIGEDGEELEDSEYDDDDDDDYDPDELDDDEEAVEEEDENNPMTDTQSPVGDGTVFSIVGFLVRHSRHIDRLLERFGIILPLPSFWIVSGFLSFQGEFWRTYLRGAAIVGTVLVGGMAWNRLGPPKWIWELPDEQEELTPVEQTMASRPIDDLRQQIGLLQTAISNLKDSSKDPEHGKEQIIKRCKELIEMNMQAQFKSDQSLVYDRKELTLLIQTNLNQLDAFEAGFKDDIPQHIKEEEAVNEETSTTEATNSEVQ